MSALRDADGKRPDWDANGNQTWSYRSMNHMSLNKMSWVSGHVYMVSTSISIMLFYQFKLCAALLTFYWPIWLTLDHCLSILLFVNCTVRWLYSWATGHLNFPKGMNKVSIYLSTLFTKVSAFTKKQPSWRAQMVHVCLRIWSLHYDGKDSKRQRLRDTLTTSSSTLRYCSVATLWM